MASTSSLTFAELLRYHRTAAGLTQEELAARARLSVDAVSTLERGTRRTPRKDTVALLADALALAPEDRAAFVIAATAVRRSSIATLAATPGEDTARDGRLPAVADDLPRGIVTFLVGDIEDSTALLQRLGDDQYAAVLAEAHALLRAVWVTHHGHELGTQGDQFFVVFAQASDALTGAVEAQQALARHPLANGAQVRMRMGIHTGPALLTAGRYVGLEVLRAVRIAAAGHGGQILLSEAVVNQLEKEGQGPPGLQNLGRHRLPDFTRPEYLYQMLAPDLPIQFPPLRTLNIWPAVRTRLVMGALLTLTLLTLVCLILPFVVPTFPRVLGLITGLGALLLGGSVALVQARYPLWLQRQWREMRQPVVAVTSCLLSLVVVLTTLFATKPPVFLKPASTGYDFTYAYHQPTKTGGTITVGLASAMISLAPAGISSLQVQNDQYLGLWQSCLVQLPDLSLGLSGWKADQCSEVPTVANGDESPDFKTTILRIDPRAVWSDGVPITADDFLFAFRLYADPTIYGVPMTATALNEHTVQITWPTPTVDYLDVLAPLSPLPLHAYATGAFAGVYGPTTGAYNAKLAQQLIIDPSFTRKISVDNGPFTLQRIVTKQVNPFNHKKLITVITSATVIKNPHFFSNFFHTPALDQVTFESAWEDFGDNVTRKQWQDDMVARYRQGGLEEVESLDSLNLKELSGIPAGEVITSPLDSWFDMGFNQRNVAPNAQANDGTSMFTDKSVRQAFIEAFDRCSAMRALLAIKNCSDPNLFSDELTAPPAVDFDPTFHLPSYNPTDAADLLDRAGYPVIDGIRRGKDKKTPLQLQLTLSFSALDMKDLAVRMTQDYAKNLQISVTVLDMDNNVAQAVAPQGAFDLAIWADGGFPSDPIGIVLGEGGGWDAADIPSAQNPNGSNIYGLIDPYVVARDQLGSHIQDGGQRAEVYEQLQRYVSEQFDFQPILLLSDVTLTKTTLCNFKKSSVSNNTWNMADWYVAPSCP